jgi:hypothetical protein
MLVKEALCWVQHCRLEAIIGDTLMALHYPVARASRYLYQGITSRERCIHSTAMCIKHHPQPVDTSEVTG